MKDVSSRPHVVVVANDFGFPSGMAATQRVRLLCRAMLESGAGVTVLCPGATEDLRKPQNMQAAGTHDGIDFIYATGTPLIPRTRIRRVLLRVYGLAAAVIWLIRRRAAGRLDGLYLWGVTMRLSPTRPLFTATARLLGVPAIAELNERPWSLKESPSFLERLVSPLSGVQGAIAISHHLSGWAESEASRLQRPLRLAQVPIVVDLTEAEPQPFPAGRPRVLFAASPAYTESLSFILNAMERVWSRHPDCQLIATCVELAGLPIGGAWATTLPQRIAGGQLVLPGHLDRGELLRAYTAAHALLAPLFDDVRSEARFPTKIGEYLAAARPVITNAVGEIARFFRDGEDALVAPPGDIAAYAERICSILADPARAAAIGRAGRALAGRHFHYSLYGADLLRVFGDRSHRPGSATP